VLVVDDDAIVRGLICHALEDDGLSVVAAENGRVALEQAALVRPRLIVLDVSLPIVAGSGVAAGVREIVSPDVPILVITADGHPLEKARALGAYASLSKPFDVDELVALVRSGLQRA
jgi:DNA-binding response OmpR family regulator